jgi:hypothetical protein
MNGSVFIISEKGLYCSNDADFTVDRKVIKDDSGKIISSKHTQVINVMNFMRIKGEIGDNEDVYCQFKFDDTNEVKTFSASISAFTPEMIILNLKALNLRHKEVTETIKNKIKEEINHG